MSIPPAYREVFESHDNLFENVVKTHVDRLSDIDKILPPSSAFLMLTNTTNYSYEYISQNFEYVTGHSREALYKNGISFFLSLMHVDDIPTWLIVLKELMEFCMTEVKEENRKKMNFQYNYRIRTSKGFYINVVESQIPLHLDAFGKPVIGLGHFIAFGNGEFQPLKASARILNDQNEYETIFFKNYSNQLLIDSLSHRERDILRMLALSKTSKEIAEKFFISHHTVDTHRRNIIKKLNLSSTVEIVAYCQFNGYLY